MHARSSFVRLIIAITIIVANFTTATKAVQALNNQQATAVVLVNSASASYDTFHLWLQPYLDQFGVPYTVLDIATTPVGSDIANQAVIIIGHSQLDPLNTYLSSAEQSNITAAVNGGSGLVNFDNDLSSGTTGRYAFVTTIFGFSYNGATTASGVTFASPGGHYITARHQAGETITTATMNLARVTLPAGVTALAKSGQQSFLVAETYGQGRAVQWGTGEWMDYSIKGPLGGLDDLVWRSIVWAARKPFAMQAMPPFVTFRMDDVIGPLDWIHVANEVGFKPWAGVFINEMSAASAADLSSLVRSGMATANVHAFGSGTNDMFYMDQYNPEGAQDFPDDVMAEHFALGSQWFNKYNIPISKYTVGHLYDIGSNTYDGFNQWGVEFLGTISAPGTVDDLVPWLQIGPYRKYLDGWTRNPQKNVVFQDFMDFPNHPQQMFDCFTEIRDVDPRQNYYDWEISSDNPDSATTIKYGSEILKRSLDSMILATLFTHEQWIYVDMPTFRQIMQGVAANIASYKPIYVTMDEGCQYARAITTSNISDSQYDPNTQVITVSLSGKTDMVTKFYLFTEFGGTIIDTLVNVPVFNGSTQVQYAVGGTEIKTITVTPNPVNVQTGATQQFTATGYDASNNAYPALNITWSVVNGGGAINNHGLFTAGNTVGTYSNTVKASYNGINAYATVIVTAPNQAPTASNGQVSTPEDTQATVTLQASDPENSPLTYTIVTNPAHGSLSGTAPNLTYQPAANYNGSDSFTFNVSDGSLSSNTATVSITISPVNDPPAASNGNVTTPEDTPKDVTLQASDIDSSSLTYTIVTNPTHGSLSGTAPNLSYTPAANYNGTDSFTFKASDGSLESNIATISITISAVNDAPVAQNDLKTTLQNTPVSITLHATDVDSSTLTYSIVSAPKHGALTGTAPNLVFTPASGYTGTDSFTFKANDGKLDSNIATISLVVNNGQPVAQADSYSLNENQSLNVAAPGVLGNDSDPNNDPLQAVLVVGPAHGTLVLQPTGAFVYTPAQGYFGEDSFQYKVNDGKTDSSPVTVKLSIAAVNDPLIYIYLPIMAVNH